MNRSAINLLLLVMLCVVGCTKYEYVIVDPPDLATTISGKQESQLTTTAAKYRLRVVDNVLVMLIYNPGGAAMQLVGARSVVVGPDGASHPIIGQTIAAGSFIKLILPPPRPQLEPDGPGFSYGFGVSSGGYDRGSWYTRSRYKSRRYYGAHDDVTFYDPPNYTVYDAANPAYWDWRGETQIKLTLSYDRDGKTAEDSFVIQRRKAK